MGGPKDERVQRQELDDLNNERAGNETGRILRFLHDRDPNHIEAKKRDTERKLSALMQLLQDPDYRAAYDAAWSAYEDAQTAIHDALTETAEAVENLETITRAMDTRANRLGEEAVYQDESGRFVRLDGTVLTEQEASRVIRSAGAPSYDGRRMAQDALEAAQARRAARTQSRHPGAEAWRYAGGLAVGSARTVLADLEAISRHPPSTSP